MPKKLRTKRPEILNRRVSRFGTSLRAGVGGPRDGGFVISTSSVQVRPPAPFLFTLSQEGHRKIDGLARRFSLYAKFDTLTDTLGVGSLTAEHSVHDRRGLRRGLLLQVAVEVCGDPQLRMPEELGHLHEFHAGGDQ
jgi:hypothetical protein